MSIGLGFGWEVEIDLVIVRAENYLVFVRVSKLSWFCVGGRNYLDFSVGVENDVVFVWVVEIDYWLGFCVRDENDLFLVWGSIDSVFVGMVETDEVFCAIRKWLGFRVGIEITLGYRN